MVSDLIFSSPRSHGEKYLDKESNGRAQTNLEELHLGEIEGVEHLVNFVIQETISDETHVVRVCGLEFCHSFFFLIVGQETFSFNRVSDLHLNEKR